MATTDQRNRVAMENDGSRVDARAKVTGAAKYTADINLPNMMYACYIRSPFAEGKLVSKDEEAAKKIKGVLDVAFTRDDTKPAEYSGISVGYVCAESPQLLLDAIAALKMKWEHGEPRTNLRKLAGPFPEPEDEDKAKLDEVYKKSAHVVEGTYETQMQHHVSLEPHGAVVDFKGDKARVWGSTQGTYSFRDGLKNDLGIDSKDIEFFCDYVGGGFGSKFGPGIEGKLAAQMSKKFNRPCRMVNNRKEESRDTGMRPGSLQYFKLGVDDKGKIVGGRLFLFGSVGSRPGGGGANYVSYDLGTFVKTQKEVQLSANPTRPQRAPGWPQGAFALDGIMDQCAAAAGLDPIQFRKINDPNKTRLAQYDIVAKEIGWDKRKADGTWPGKLKRGFGVGAAEWGNRGHGPASAEIRIYPDGKLEIRSGTQDIGTGNRTMLVDLTAHGMGLDRKFITGLCGSTNYPSGPASGGSVVGRSIGPAVLNTADMAAKGILELAAKELKAEPDSLAIKGDAIVAKADGAKKMDWAAACKLIGTDHLTFTGNWDEKFAGKGNSEGVCAAEVEVDTETGVIRLIKIVNAQCCGMPVNRKVVESQICGGTIQGIGYTLFEDRILNVANGATVNPNMEWYKLPGPADMPEIVPILHVPEGYTGVFSLGEPPIIGVPGAISNAVVNAIGARVFSLPLTPAKVLAALKEKGGVA